MHEQEEENGDLEKIEMSKYLHHQIYRILLKFIFKKNKYVITIFYLIYVYNW